VTRPIKLIGIGASPGAAVGPAFLIDRRQVQEPRRHVQESEVDAEIIRLHQAIQIADQQLDHVRNRLAGQPQEHALIIDAHRLMLTDPAVVQGAEALIRDEQINAEWAVRRTIRQIAATFDAIDDPYFAERKHDVEFVGDRIVECLVSESPSIVETPPDGSIVVANDLSPADAMLLLNGRAIGGIVTAEGGRTSHTAIVARALEVPAVLGVSNLSEVVGKGDLVALDGSSGVVVVHPSDADQRAFFEVRRRFREQEEEAIATRGLPASTADGHRIRLRANIELVEEIPSIIAHGAEGIGLYRTEFLYLNRRDVPTEEEHFAVYKRLLEALPGQQITVRTFDLGGEKVMLGRAHHESNPALGLRAIRYCLAHPEMFLPQLRALWRASALGNLRVMFPLISGVGELRRAKKFFEEARHQVIADGHDVADHLPLGIMVETPAAAMLSDHLAEEADFFAIGTNDLIQYTIAIDRRNHDVSYLYQPMHPSLLRMMKMILEGAKPRGIPVSICGEVAGDPAYTLILIALGFEELSMSGTAIPMVKRIVRSSTMADARALLTGAMQYKTGPDVETYVRDEMARRFPDVCGQLPLVRPAIDDSLVEMDFMPS
jgi:phosphotransferase system enzyme I (PtsI)